MGEKSLLQRPLADLLSQLLAKLICVAFFYMLVQFKVQAGNKLVLIFTLELFKIHQNNNNNIEEKKGKDKPKI